MRRRHLHLRAATALLLLACAVAFLGTMPAQARASPNPAREWPTDPVVVTAPFRAPAHAYGSGHRGVDLLARPGQSVVSPADGTVLFVGWVVDRNVVTIDHGDGYVSTLEPVDTELSPGVRVARGGDVGVVSAQGHVAGSDVHWGVRLNGVYVDPAALIEGRERAVLLPCC